MDTIMFCFSILKLKIFPFHNFCSFTLLLYTQSVISEAQLLRKKKANSDFAGLTGLCSNLPVSPRTPSVPPSESGFFQFKEFQLKAGKEWKTMHLVIAHFLPFILQSAVLVRWRGTFRVWILFEFPSICTLIWFKPLPHSQR